MAPRLADASGGAAPARPAAGAASRPASASGTRATPGTYYAGLETVPPSLAGVLVYLYPAIVAVLSVRYATRLAGRRPWIALGIALVGVVLALGGIDLATPPPVGGIAADPRLAA